MCSSYELHITYISIKVVPEARVELARVSSTVFETAASAISPLGHDRIAIITYQRVRV